MSNLTTSMLSMPAFLFIKCYVIIRSLRIHVFSLELTNTLERLVYSNGCYYSCLFTIYISVSTYKHSERVMQCSFCGNSNSPWEAKTPGSSANILGGTTSLTTCLQPSSLHLSNQPENRDSSSLSLSLYKTVKFPCRLQANIPA